MKDSKTNEKVKQLIPENPPVKNVEEIQDPVIKRRVKMEQLSQKIVKIVETESKDGTFSIFEITEVFAKLIHAYNKRFLNAEHQNLANEQNPDKG